MSTDIKSELEKIEAKLWDELVEKFDDEQKHKEYLKFCVQNDMIGRAIKRYSEYADAKDKYPLELRRKAHYKHQQLLNIMMIGTKTRAEASRKPFRSISVLDALAIALILLLFFGSLLLESWLVGITSLIALGGYIAYKFMQAMRKLERRSGGEL